MYIYICIYLYISLSLYIYIYECIYVYAYFLNSYMYKYTYVHKHIYISTPKSWKRICQHCQCAVLYCVLHCVAVCCGVLQYLSLPKVRGAYVDIAKGDFVAAACEGRSSLRHDSLTCMTKICDITHWHASKHDTHT